MRTVSIGKSYIRFQATHMQRPSGSKLSMLGQQLAQEIQSTFNFRHQELIVCDWTHREFSAMQIVWVGLSKVQEMAPLLLNQTWMDKSPGLPVLAGFMMLWSCLSSRARTQSLPKDAVKII
mmetsp:Transcript_155373/g.298255  ORF Transcript_155373/g.298255 Transcript_155373/m.298255 type:complete len:121 (+) Transcript_155373:205-567(+)